MLASMGKQESSEISLHEVLVWQAFDATWKTANDVSQSLKGKVAARTVRAHAHKLVALGLLDVMEVFPGHRYRASEKASKRNMGYFQRLQKAAEVFAIEIAALIK